MSRDLKRPGFLGRDRRQRQRKGEQYERPRQQATEKAQPLVEGLLKKAMSIPPPQPAVNPGPTNVFHIAFETQGKDGYIRAIKVTIEEDVMDSMDLVRVDLACHPLYSYLQDYIKNNPR